MSPFTRQTSSLRERTAVTEYGSLFALLLASLLLSTFANTGAERTVEALSLLFGARPVTAIGVALFGVALVTAVRIATANPDTAETGLARDEFLTVAGVTGLALFVASYRFHDAIDQSLFVDVLARFLEGVVAMAALGYVYAAARQRAIRFEVPRRDSVSLVGAVVLGAAFVGLAVTIFAHSIAEFWPVPGPFVPTLSVGLVTWRVLLPAAFAGFGMGVFYNGAIQETLRQRTRPAGGAAGATALTAVVGWTLPFAVRPGDPVTTVGSAAVVAALGLLAAVLTARAVRTAARSLDADPSPLAASAGVVVVVLAATILPSPLVPSLSVLAPGLVGLTAVAAIACVGYERSRSVWVPAVGFAAYRVATDVDLAGHLVQVLG